MRRRPVTFASGGVLLAAELHFPGPGVHPGVVICPGWAGRRSKSSEALAAALADAGFAALAFDFRGFGASQGDRHRLIPAEQAQDINAAAHYLRSHRAVDPARVAAVGILTGGAAALQAAAENPAIAAVVAFYPFGDGARWLRSMRRYWEWRGLEAMISADRVRRAAGEASLIVDADQILMRGPESITIDETGQLRSVADRPSRDERRLNLESAEAIMEFAPERVAARLSPRPVLIIAAEDDLLLPVDEARTLYRHLRQPRKLVVLKGISHHQALDGEHRSEVLSMVVDFLNASLPATARGTQQLPPRG